MRVVTCLLLTALLVPGLAGCGDDASPEDACVSWVETSCNKIQSCSDMFMAVTYGSVATCIERLQTVCAPILAAPGTKLTAGDFSGCAASTSAQSCEDLIAGLQPAGCRISGSLDDGKACASDVQCVNAYCKKTGGASCGVCSKRVAAGETCDEDEDCDGDLACRQQVCVAYVAAGGTCDATHPCREPLRCDSGACAKPVGVGETCDPTRQNCDGTQGLFCGLQSKVCEKAGLAGDGEACGLATGGSAFTLCKASGHCTAATGGTCQAAAADGQSCDMTKGPYCLPPASCEGGVCKLEDPSACK